MDIRRYRAEDLPAVVRLFTAAVHGLAGREYSPQQLAAWAPAEPDLQAWARRLAGQRSLIAEAQNRLLGFIAFDEHGHIDLLYTAPNAARQGVASALYCAAEEALRRKGVTDAFTEASLVAAPFFARHGFVQTEVQNVVRCGVALRRYAMRKRLTQPAAGPPASGQA